VIYIQRIIKPTETVTNFWCPLCGKEIFKGANCGKEIFKLHQRDINHLKKKSSNCTNKQQKKRRIKS
jgi:predicted RNA-binding Zn-ribbon protein involved in translation (DUF1610 family)